MMKMMCKLLPALLACMLLGSVQTAGAGDNPVQDIASLQAKAKAGDAEAQCALADRYMSGQGIRQDYAKGIEWYRKAAAQGSAEGQHWLGVIYYEGTGVKQDYAKALEWFRKAADQGHASAQGWLGGMYSEGKGVAQDKSQAKEWYRKACSGGDAHCCKESERLEKEGF
ncbi:MAG: sel1 repeat family protein [Desulfovibrio sp.]|nr:sel1 repeat family protein [Desulfovibrio sp.]